MKKILIGVGVVILLAVVGRVFWAYQQVKVDEQSVTPPLNIVKNNFELETTPTHTTTTKKATSPETETADWKVYRNELYGLSFKYPKDWGDPYNPQGDRLNLVNGNSVSLRIPTDDSALYSFIQKYHFEGVQIEARFDQRSILDDYAKEYKLIDMRTLTVDGAQAIQGKKINYLSPDLDSGRVDSYYTFVKYGSFIYQFRNKPSESFLVGGATSESAQDLHNKILSTVEFF